MKKPYDAAVFDLDGTLLDTLEDLADSMNGTLSSFGYPVHPDEAYKIMVGNGWRRLVEVAVGSACSPSALSEELVTKMLADFSDRYYRAWNNKTRPYPGISDMLDRLSADGIPVAVLSNKADAMTKLVVAHYFPGIRFAAVYGQRPCVPAKPDPSSALEISGLLGVAPSRTVYLGDSGVDMATATNAGMYAAGVLWGFRGREELQEAGARVLLDKPEDIFALFS
jgi:phosphoglycolate phosphatase